MKYLGQISNDNDIVNKKKLDTELANKMDKASPTGTGSLSINRKANTTIGTNSFVAGNNNEASGVYSSAIGCNNIASGQCSFAEGGFFMTPQMGNTASGAASHAEGIATTASGAQSHSEGDSTVASGKLSHAEGYSTIAQRSKQHVFGKYNIADTTGADGTAEGSYVEIVGNGTGASDRSNARTLDWDGNEWLAGKITPVGGISDGNNANYELQIPDTTSWTADKNIATTDQIPTVNDATITITQGGVTKGTFTLNQSSAGTIALDSGIEFNMTDVQITEVD